MRALLINPWIYDFAAYDLWFKPLGILRIAACLKHLGFDVSLIDCLDRFHPALKEFLKGKIPKTNIFGSGRYYSEIIDKPSVFKSIPRRFKRYGLPQELFKETIKKEPRPDIILITSAMTYWYPGVFEAIRFLRERFDSVPIVLGGNYARICFEHAKKNSGADFVYKGNKILEILNLIGKLTNVSFNYSQIDKTRHLFPAYELYDELSYVTLRTSGGCPFRCSYCAWYLLEDGLTQEEPDFVADQIEHFYKKYGIKNFSFYDDALLHNAEKHIMKILKEVIKRKIHAYFHTPNGLHVRFMTPELAKLLNRAGFILPRLGLETSSVKRQIESGTKTTTKEFLKVIKYLKDAGYNSKDIAVNILMGLPGQSFKEIKDSIEFAASLKVRIFLEEYSPIPNTPDYLKSGLAPDADPLLHNNSAFPLHRPDEYHNFQELKDLVHKFNKLLYNN